jgi:hypothetical protein
MSDSRALLQGLIQYHGSLERHISSLGSEYEQLSGRWRAFSSVAAGDYADEFRGGWQRTDSNFQNYINQSQQIKALLSERIQALQELNRTEGGV